MTIKLLQHEFHYLDQSLQAVLAIIPPTQLYNRNLLNNLTATDPTLAKPRRTIGELAIHIIQIQEYLCNGLSANFWDYPHEWTSREILSDCSAIAGYLQEVIELREGLLARLTDADLMKLVYLPDRSPAQIGQLLMRALVHCSHHRGQLFLYLSLIGVEPLPPISPTVEGFKRLL